MTLSVCPGLRCVRPDEMTRCTARAATKVKANLSRSNVGSKSLNLALLRPKLPPGILTPQDSWELKDVGRLGVKSGNHLLFDTSPIAPARSAFDIRGGGIAIWHHAESRQYRSIRDASGSFSSFPVRQCWAMLQYVYILRLLTR